MLPGMEELKLHHANPTNPTTRSERLRDQETGQVSNPLYAFKNYYVVSKSKEACGQLVAGQEFETTVSVHTNETNEMRLEWTSTFEDIEEEVKGAIGAGEEEPSVEEGASTDERDKGVAVGVPDNTADDTLGDDVDNSLGELGTMSRNLVCVLGIALTICGCRIGDPVDPDALKARVSIARSFGTGSREAVESGWLASFGDANLTALVLEALEGNPDLAIAAAQVERAAGFARQAGALLKPTIDFGAGGFAGGNDAGGSARAGGASLDLTWELDVWGRLRSQASVAENEFMAAGLMYAYGRQSLAAQVAKSWFLCVETHLQVETAEDAVSIYKKTLEITQKKFELNAVARNDVQLAEADVASAEEALREARGAHQQASRALEILLGRYPSAEIKVAREFAAVPEKIPVGLPTELLERRADLVAAERRVAAAFENVRVAKAARLPRVAITASAGGSSAQFKELGNPQNVFWNIGANMLAPLFDGGFLEAEQDIATAEQKASVAEYRKAGLQAFADVENGLSNETLLRQREEFLRTALDKNRQAWELAQNQFDAGEIDLLSVLQLQRRVLNARVALINIQGRRLSERVNLHLGLGGNFEFPEGLDS